MRILLIAAGVVAGVPTVAAIAAQIYAAVTVAGVAYQINQSIDEIEKADQPPVGAYQVENVTGDEALWSGYNALSRIGEPVDERVITFNAYVKLRELMKPGEERPEPDFADVFVDARASAFAETECARVLKKLASQCVVRNVSTYRVEKDASAYNISVTLGFVQKDPLGKVDEKGRLAYREVSDDLAPGGSQIRVMPEEAARQREKFYEEATRACIKLRKAEGNCAIYRIDIRASKDQGSDALQLYGNAQFSFLQPLKI
jgi:hypothetical protein